MLQIQKFDGNLYLIRWLPNKVAVVSADQYAKTSSHKKLYTSRKKQLQSEPFTESSMQTKHKKKHSTGGKCHTSLDKKKLSLETLKYLLDQYNKIWEDGIVTEGNLQQ